MSGAPRVAVVMPVYDADPGYLRDAIQSLLDQSFDDFELIVVEDPSPRSAAEVVGAFRDPRVTHLSNPKQNGLGAALNFGIATSRAALVARMDADDLAVRDRLAVQVAAFDADPSLDLLGSQIAIIDAHGAPKGFRVYPETHDAIVRALRRYNCFSHPSVMFRRNRFDDVGGYGEGIVHEDYDLWCKLARAGAKLANRPERLVSYRFHPDSLKLRDIRKMLVETIRVKERYFSGQLGPRERARIAGERLLTFVPGPWVVKLFAALEYHQLPGRAERSRS
jgi:glycosyltransferase involved in cell wall biosynthesis